MLRTTVTTLVPATYREVLGVPGAAGFVTAGFVARLPMAMRALACLLLVVAATGSYALAGAVSAVLALASAAGAPLLARLADRHGQRRMILGALAVHAVGATATVVLVAGDAPSWTYFPAVVVFGVSAPPFGSLVRARWAALLDEGGGVRAAYALEAVLEELVYILGPPLAVLLAVHVAPGVGLLGALAPAVAGGLALARQRATEPPTGAPVRTERAGVLRVPGLRTVTGVYAMVGVLLGAIDPAMVAFAEDHGAPAMAGAFLAVLAVAGMVAGVRFGTVAWRVSQARVLTGATAVLCVLSAPLAFAASLPVMAVCAALAGAGLSPVLITGSSLVPELLPRTVLTEGFAVIGSAATVGMAAGTALGGRLIDTGGPGAAFALAFAAGAAACAVTIAGRRSLKGVIPSSRID
ncbi:MAG TPA: MFS transporter [Thermomonospora sp.]|nr:MFS transporter [Thermomonospora sp.]